MKAVFPHQAFKILVSAMIFTVYSSLFFAVNVQANHSHLIPSETLSDEPIQPLRIHEGLAPEKITLGRSLFFDKRLSKDNSIRCSSCHNLAHGGTDNLQFSIGVSGTTGKINTPTVYNTHLNLAQFWDGRISNLIEQVSGPVENPLEMASSWPDIILKLGQDKNFMRRYKKIYGDKLEAGNLIDAIATFEQSLTTVNSPFDRFLAGDKNAISAQAREGYQIFKSYGCTACHQGANVGGNMYQKMGVMADYFEERGTPITEANLGRYNVTHDNYDKFTFKVPSLRLVVLTAPYFHDGSVSSLEQAINKMARYQLSREISAEDVQKVIAFLKTLVGEHKELTQSTAE